MGFLDNLGFGAKKKKKVSTRQKVDTKKRQKRKPAKKSAKVESASVVEPIMAVSSQMTHISRDLQEVKSLMQSGFSGLREDHHKILEDQFSKTDIEEFKSWTEKRTLTLEKVKAEADEEIKLLECDRKILELIQQKPLQSAEVGKKLKVTRQYAATRLNLLTDNGLVKSKKEGRKVYYTAD